MLGLGVIGIDLPEQSTINRRIHIANGSLLFQGLIWAFVTGCGDIFLADKYVADMLVARFCKRLHVLDPELIYILTRILTDREI